MISSRELSRRNFCHAFLVAGVTALTQTESLPLEKRRFRLGNRVKAIWTNEDRKSPNFGNSEWECGLVVGYCWSYPEWRKTEFQSGWTYFVRFDDSRDRQYFFEPYTDFVHESRLTIA